MSEQSGTAISEGKFAVFHYDMFDVEGELLESTREDVGVGFVHGKNELLIPALEEALTGKTAGDSFELALGPEDAYGARDPDGYVEMPRDGFPEDIDVQVGMPFSAEDDEGIFVPVWVQEIKDDVIVVTTNHPLAGANVVFQVEVMEVREPTAEELEPLED